MKARFGIPLALLCMIALLSACNTEKTPSQPEEASFLATLLEVHSDSILVEPVEGESIRNSANRIAFSPGTLEDIDAQPGDTLRITYTGNVRETDPAQIDVLRWEMEKKAIHSQDRSLLADHPPSVFVSYGSDQVTTLPGTSLWYYFDPETKGFVGLAADAMHPLQAKTFFPRLTKTNERRVQILPSIQPDRLAVVYWPESLLGTSNSFPTGTSLPLASDNSFTLPDQTEGYIIQINATWDNEGSSTSYGDASYSFCINSPS